MVLIFVSNSQNKNSPPRDAPTNLFSRKFAEANGGVFFFRNRSYFSTVFVREIYCTNIKIGYREEVGRIAR